jgi:phage/plasmid-associated DNA primase
MFVIDGKVLCTSAEPKPKGKHDWTQADHLYAEYVEWCSRGGYKRLAQNTFGERMRKLGLPSESDGSARFYRVRERKPPVPGYDAKPGVREARAADPGDQGRPDPLTELTDLLRAPKAVRQ